MGEGGGDGGIKGRLEEEGEGLVGRPGDSIAGVGGESWLGDTEKKSAGVTEGPSGLSAGLFLSTPERRGSRVRRTKRMLAEQADYSPCLLTPSPPPKWLWGSLGLTEGHVRNC